MKNITAIASLIFFSSTGLLAQEIGLQLYSVRGHFEKDAARTCQMVAEWGIQIVEEGLHYGHTVAELNEMYEDNGLKLVSASADYGDLKNRPEDVAARAKALGVKYVVCFWIPHNGNEFTVENVDAAIDVFENAGKVMESHGLTLCYHPHGYEFRPFEGTTLMDYMISRSKHFDFEIDVFWVKHSGAEPLALMRKYPDRFPLMHAKDRAHGTIGNTNGKADVDCNVVLGEGDVGIEELFREAQKMGMDYIFIEDESSRSTTQIPKSLAYLKNLQKSK